CGDAGLVLWAEFERARGVFMGGRGEGVRVSNDGGITWEDRNAGLADDTVNSLVATASGVWAATGHGVYVSHDCARTWRRSTTSAGSARIVAAGSSMMAAAFDDGHLVVSEDEGTTWRDLRLPVQESRIVALAVARGGAILLASITSVELTLWCWESRRGWSRLLVEPSTGAVRLALSASSSQPVEHGVLIGLGRRVLRPMRNAQEV